MISYVKLTQLTMLFRNVISEMLEFLNQKYNKYSKQLTLMKCLLLSHFLKLSLCQQYHKFKY